MAASPAIMSEKKMPIDRDMPEFWNVDRMPEAAPRWRAGTLLMIAEVFGEANRPEPIPLQKMISANTQYGKSTGQQHQADERAGRDQQAGGGERARAVPVGQVPRDRARRSGSRRSAAACRCPAHSGVSAKS